MQMCGHATRARNQNTRAAAVAATATSCCVYNVALGPAAARIYGPSGYRVCLSSSVRDSPMQMRNICTCNMTTRARASSGTTCGTTVLCMANAANKTHCCRRSAKCVLCAFNGN